MTNYEKYQDEIIGMLFDNGACFELKKSFLMALMSIVRLEFLGTIASYVLNQ